MSSSRYYPIQNRPRTPSNRPQTPTNRPQTPTRAILRDSKALANIKAMVAEDLRGMAQKPPASEKYLTKAQVEAQKTAGFGGSAKEPANSTKVATAWESSLRTKFRSNLAPKVAARIAAEKKAGEKHSGSQNAARKAKQAWTNVKEGMLTADTVKAAKQASISSARQEEDERQLVEVLQRLPTGGLSLDFSTPCESDNKEEVFDQLEKMKAEVAAPKTSRDKFDVYLKFEKNQDEPMSPDTKATSQLAENLRAALNVQARDLQVAVDAAAKSYEEMRILMERKEREEEERQVGMQAETLQENKQKVQMLLEAARKDGTLDSALVSVLPPEEQAATNTVDAAAQSVEEMHVATDEKERQEKERPSAEDAVEEAPIAENDFDVEVVSKVACVATDEHAEANKLAADTAAQPTEEVHVAAETAEQEEEERLRVAVAAKVAEVNRQFFPEHTLPAEVAAKVVEEVCDSRPRHAEALKSATAEVTAKVAELNRKLFAEHLAAEFPPEIVEEASDSVDGHAEANASATDFRAKTAEEEHVAADTKEQEEELAAKSRPAAQVSSAPAEEACNAVHQQIEAKKDIAYAAAKAAEEMHTGTEKKERDERMAFFMSYLSTAKTKLEEDHLTAEAASKAAEEKCIAAEREEELRRAAGATAMAENEKRLADAMARVKERFAVEKMNMRRLSRDAAAQSAKEECIAFFKNAENLQAAAAQPAEEECIAVEKKAENLQEAAAQPVKEECMAIEKKSENLEAEACEQECEAAETGAGALQARIRASVLASALEPAQVQADGTLGIAIVDAKTETRLSDTASEQSDTTQEAAHSSDTTPNSQTSEQSEGEASVDTMPESSPQNVGSTTGIINSIIMMAEVKAQDVDSTTGCMTNDTDVEAIAKDEADACPKEDEEAGLAEPDLSTGWLGFLGF
mmetsp:Transcript_81631/g.149127  ORF Transcript_81631/g.149127 Transcript_81631/m.149127 type:complete len:918 (-) Transcript_81631:125-2878(-)